MFGFGQLIDTLKKSPKKIVFTEGEDSRILELLQDYLQVISFILFLLEMKKRLWMQQRSVVLTFEVLRL